MIIEDPIAYGLAAPIAAILLLILIVIQINIFYSPTCVVGLMFMSFACDYFEFISCIFAFFAVVALLILPSIQAVCYI